MDSNFAQLAFSAILGGGLFKGIEAIYSAIVNAREKAKLSAAVGAKTPAEIESVSVTTMTSALTSAQGRITSLESEREIDRVYYQTIITDLKEQLKRVRDEMLEMERKLSELLDATHEIPERKETVV